MKIKTLYMCIIISILMWNACGSPEETSQQQPDTEQPVLSPPSGMVAIPAGFVTMGCDSANEGPRHTVWVDAFFLDKHEITNREYRIFVDSTGHPKPPFFRDSDLNKPDQPVVGVSYFDACAYARWAGKRLPTEAEWERAARGGIEGQLYPWGNDPPLSRCNYAPEGRKEKDGYEYTSPAGSFEPNNYGLYDMAGNVWEWCADFYSETYYGHSREKNPCGPDSGYSGVLRGGSWLSINPKHLRCSRRLELKPFVQDRYYGFRCAKTP
jgi:sulfatase modifying factor 1